MTPSFNLELTNTFFLMEMFVLSYVNVSQTLSSSSAKWLRTYLTNLYVTLRYCSPNQCK